MYNPKIELTPKQKDLLDGKQGKTISKMMEVIVRYGDTFDAKRLVEVTHKKGHYVTSFGINMLTPVYSLMDELINAGIVAEEGMTMDPRPMDYKNVPASCLERFVSKKIIYGKQKHYEEQLQKLGLKDLDGFTCTSYLKEVGNTPSYGDIISWAESSAVVYANSVLGARCNRNSGIIEMFQTILGYVPEFGLITDEGRKASWKIVLHTSKKPSAQLLGSAIGLKVMSDVPYIIGLDKYLDKLPSEDTIAYLKDMGAACASNGAVGLYHVANITPEAVKMQDFLLKDKYQTYIIDDAELQRVKDSYPMMWKKSKLKPKLCFIGCPHLTYKQIIQYSNKILKGLDKNGRKKTTVYTVFTAAPQVLKKFKENEPDLFKKLNKANIHLSYICPLMYVDNPLSGKKPIITNSNKLRTYSSCRYYEDDDLIDILIGKEKCR